MSSELVSTGGTFKTLHPKIYAGMLEVRGDPSHIRAAEDHEVEFVRPGVVNLCPFEPTAGQRGASDEEGDLELPSTTHARSLLWPRHVTAHDRSGDVAHMPSRQLGCVCGAGLSRVRRDYLGAAAASRSSPRLIRNAPSAPASEPMTVMA